MPSDHKPLSAQEIAEAKTLCEKATPGPWEHHGSIDSDNMRFIAAARTGWPRALADLERARELLRESAVTSHAGLCWCPLYPYLGEHSLRCDRIRAYLASAEEAP